ncbi:MULTISPECIES: LLM class flavin-dependent oxidoreductase [Agrobacterium]|uniref:Putative monooxygenase MoxC n=1 Tax=Agrobacterium rosae TaxID=1972867 RepID=A0A1R3TY33_9HYPH|nr:MULTISPECIES: LLM class flavin-dependent oxidoreductase [Agrobacterium]SCX29338.1 putative monooxygenase MoxC [Agrobacterium sp. DSM 25558]SCX31166.1 putative monooxygenase MoxC [Agrobacterium rosae]
MTQRHDLHIGIGLDAASHSHNPSSSWPLFWSTLIGDLDGAVAFVTLRDGYARKTSDGPDAVLLANWLAARTQTLGIIAGAPLNFLEPFHVSTAIATLDYVSQGRAGLLVQQLRGDRAEEAGRTIGKLKGFPTIDDEALQQDADDALETIRRLWDSWEDDAVIRDSKSQRFLDGDKLHYVNFQGSDFRVLGPSITPRPPQGQPVVAIALTEQDDPSLAAKADLIFLRQAENVFGPLIQTLQGLPAASSPILFADISLGTDTDITGLFLETISDAAHAGINGIRLVLDDPEKQVRSLREEVLPALTEAGLIRVDDNGSLRQRLGLPVAINRYARVA